MFRAFIDEPVALYGVEAAGEGVDERHATPRRSPRAGVGVLHGARTMVLADDDGQILEAHSVSAGLDYPGVGPEHASLMKSGRATYLSATDDEALAADEARRAHRGHPRSRSRRRTPSRASPTSRSARRSASGRPVRLAVCLSGRGDKDLGTLLEPLASETEPAS